MRNCKTVLRSHGRRAVAFLPCLLLIALAAAPGARAADRLYWDNFDGPSISYANLDGSGGGTLPTGAAPLDGPMGMAIDSAQGRLYWANYGEGPNGCGDGCGTTISWANLDGSGAGEFATSGAVAGPHGLAIDQATQKIYWPNDAGPDANTIAYSSLDGSGGGFLNTGSATVVSPRGLVIDPATHRIYWANHDGDKISYANLDGSGGGDVPTGAATVSMPEGVAIDPVAGRIYWGNFTAGTDVISWASLDGSAAGNLNTSGTSVDSPHGVAIDPVARRIYWANYNSTVDGTPAISYANLDDSGGHDLPIAGASAAGPAMPLVLDAPGAMDAPSLKGGSSPGSRLSCVAGAWTPDAFSSLFYRAPSSVSYAWSNRGQRVAGGESGSLGVHAIGIYRCEANGANAAGSASATSAPHAVFRLGRVHRSRTRGTAQLKVAVPAAGTLSVRGRKVVFRRAAAPNGGAADKLTIKAKHRAKRRLQRTGRLRVRVRVTYAAQGAAPETQTKTLRLLEVSGH